jgi:hypothetical protein
VGLLLACFGHWPEAERHGIATQDAGDPRARAWSNSQSLARSKVVLKTRASFETAFPPRIRLERLQEVRAPVHRNLLRANRDEIERVPGRAKPARALTNESEAVHTTADAGQFAHHEEGERVD